MKQFFDRFNQQMIFFSQQLICIIKILSYHFTTYNKMTNNK